MTLSAATDPNHLILGDRWEANAVLPDEVVRAALRYVRCAQFSMLWNSGEYRHKDATLGRLRRQAGSAGRRGGAYTRPSATPNGPRQPTACTMQTTIAR